MVVEESNGCEYKYNWLDETTVHVGHFLVKGGFGKGTGTEGLQALLRDLEAEGAERVIVNMGGGERTERFLEKFGFTVRSINQDGHVNAVLDMADYEPPA